MASYTTIEASCDGRPLKVLSDLIRKRENALNETSRDAAVATAINVVTSLKAMTKKAPMKANDKMFFNVRQIPGYRAGWERVGTSYHRVARDGSGHVDRNITRMCRNLVGKAFSKGEVVGVWGFQLYNENLNKTVYYCFATDEKHVRDYAKKVILARLLKKESGMAKYTLGIAQARISTRSEVVPPSGAKQMRIAYDAARVIMNSTGFDEGEFSIEVADMLRYSLKAVKGEKAAMDMAIMSAANKTAGLIHLAYVNKGFGQDVKTPFPEVKRK